MEYIMKDLTKEGRLIQESFKKNIIQKNSLSEGFFSDLVWAIKSNIKNFIMWDSAPGKLLYDRWKEGLIYKDEKSPYSKSVSWYEPDSIKSKAQEYQTAFDQHNKSRKALYATIEKILKANNLEPTSSDTPEAKKVLSTSKEYLNAYIAMLKANIKEMESLNELEIVMGKREKKNPFNLHIDMFDEKTGKYLGKSVDKELLYQHYPKEWVDEMDLDVPSKANPSIEFFNEKIKEAESQLSNAK